VLLAVYPLCRSALLISGGVSSGDGEAALRGARDLGRLVVGLFPALLAVSALVEVSGARTLQVAGISAAPESAAQFLVRVLSGAALLVALPWWLDARGSGARVGAGAYAGGFLQGAALAALWSSLVLPAPGEVPWALAVAIGGALFAYAGMKIISRRWASGRRERDAANLAWATALPAAAIALAVALWPGA
jgi:hypothetical protein